MNNQAEDLPLLLKSLRFAANRHRHQRRKDASASPYINHPIAVAHTLSDVGGIMDATTLAAALLHDTIEDTHTSPEELEAEFGREIRSIVEEVSDDKRLPWKMRKRLQVQNAGRSTLRARLVKLADKINNLQDLVETPPEDWSWERRRKYLDWSCAVVDELRGTHPELERRFDEVAQQAKRQLGRAEAREAGSQQ